MRHLLLRPVGVTIKQRCDFVANLHYFGYLVHRNGEVDIWMMKLQKESIQAVKDSSRLAIKSTMSPWTRYDEIECQSNKKNRLCELPKHPSRRSEASASMVPPSRPVIFYNPLSKYILSDTGSNRGVPQKDGLRGSVRAPNLPYHFFCRCWHLDTLNLGQETEIRQFAELNSKIMM